MLTHAQLAVLVEALDSHAYWQLSDPFYRREGYVNPPGSDVAETAREIARSNRLRSRLEQQLSELDRE